MRQYQTDSGRDRIQPCFNIIDNGQRGYNNLQWSGGIVYHKFTDKFNVAAEAYYELERDVNDAQVPLGAALPNGTPANANTAYQDMVNPPLAAQCGPSLNVCPLAKEYGLFRAESALARIDDWILGVRNRGP